ncbi:MAG TPA: di-heme oxidoredictase family protein [Myxococcota bacterium]|jgi:mono/diheme cytochrome c family protein|nr:di-heme oxidoredictase family protein [Myxococcota bacterium]
MSSFAHPIRWSLACVALALLAPPAAADGRGDSPFDDVLRLVAEGRQTFRFDTFGDEVFWGDTLRLHEALAQTTPRQALELGLKIDVEALSRRLAFDLRRGRVDLDDPANTVALLRQDAVVGVTGFFEGGQLVSVGTQCALCHSTVDDSLQPGVGRRLDGWANRDLDIGRIIASAPDLSVFEKLLGADTAAVKEVLEGWGVGKFDASLLLDGKTEGPKGSAAVLIPPAFGLAGINLHTWTGWGSVPHWNALVANLEMGGQGTFVDRRLDDAGRFPIAAREGFSNVRRTPDRVTPKLPGLHLFQLALKAPRPPRRSFDASAAERGQEVFALRCASCHVPPIYTEPGHNLHAPSDIGIDAFQAERSPARGYRTSPLAGLWTHTKGGFYHDGRFETLDEVVNHYESVLGFTLSDAEQSDLVEFLKSL